MINVLANVQGRDLGGVYSEVQELLGEIAPKLKPGNTHQIAGQAESMHRRTARWPAGSFSQSILVYLVMVVNFQSWIMPAASP